MFNALSLCTALARVPSGLAQSTTYNVFVSMSITGVLRIPHFLLIPQRSISVSSSPNWVFPVIFGEMGVPRLVFQIFEPVLISNA